ncbi:phage portal protein [Escherichia coli]
MISDELRAANSAGAIATGLLALKIPVPLTTVQWADRHYYLPKESSYTPGRWETLPFQVAIMNSMGNDRIRTVNLIKSARVGYTKMLLGVEAYFIEHKSRNSLLFQPTDSAAEDFMKSHVEPTIRDVPVLLDLAPWFGRKHRDNTLTLKRFSSGVGFWCLGGAAAKNYREKSVDVVCYDELSSFEPDVEKEGSPKAFEYIAGAPQEQKDNPLINILEKFSSWYDTNNVTLGGVKIPHLFPGDDLKLQTAQDSDNGFSALEQALLRYIAAGLGVSYEQLSRDYSKVSYSSARASANESWRYFMGRRKFIAARLATQMFSCWLEEALLRGIIRPPRARFDFYQARSAWSRAEWIGAGRMAIDGLKEVQESVMRIEAGLSTYEKELALMGEDYQDIFRQQVRESAERQKAGLSRPVWIAQAYQQQIAESRRPEEETTPRET